MKKLLFAIFILIMLIAISKFATSIYTLWHKKDLLIIAKKELQKEEEENKQLKGEFSWVKSQEFIEEEARNKLFMVKPGENNVVIPTAAIHTMVIKKLPKQGEKSYWQQWIDLFFH